MLFIKVAGSISKTLFFGSGSYSAENAVGILECGHRDKTISCAE